MKTGRAAPWAKGEPEAFGRFMFWFGASLATAILSVFVLIGAGASVLVGLAIVFFGVAVIEAVTFAPKR